MKSAQSLRVIRSLQRAAEKAAVLPYQRFHAIFDGTCSLRRRYEILEEAIQTLADASDVDYGSLLACDNGLPGPEFFLRFRRTRWNDYVTFIGDPRFQSATVKRKWLLVDHERRKVYVHAAQACELERA
jgi:hypothetical protein